MASNAPIERDEPETISDMTERLRRIEKDLEEREAALDARSRDINAQEALRGNPNEYEVVDEEAELTAH